MGVCVDDDTMKAVIAAWKADKTLTSLLPLPPERPRLASPQPMPYAEVSSTLDHREQASSSGAWFDWRRVSIIVRGTYEQVVPILAAARDVFYHGMTLTYPSGARHLLWLPDRDTTLTMEEGSKDGEDIWKGELSALCESTRLR